MSRAAAVDGAAAWTVLLVVSALGSQTPALGNPCLSNTWFELNALGHWSPFTTALGTVTAEDPSGRDPPAEIQLPWATVRERALNLSRKLGDGLSLPVTTCPTPPSLCSASLPPPYAPCTRTVQRALCVAVEGGCKALLVTVEEPGRCCCGLEERNSTRTTGKVTRVLLRDICSLLIDDDARQGGAGGGGGGRGNGGEGGRKPVMLSQNSATLPSTHEAENLAPPNNTTRDDEEELTEEVIAETSILEDVIAALVFLFIGVVLVLIRSRVFRFARKKQQQDIKEAESQETLVDESII